MPLFLVRLGFWWRSTAWPWLKRHWKWVVLFPVMAVVWLFGRRSGKVVVVNDDHESDEAEKFHRKVELGAAAKVAKLDEAREARVEEVMSSHEKTVEELNDEQRDKAVALLENPEELNSFLLDVGKRVRE